MDLGYDRPAGGMPRASLALWRVFGKWALILRRRLGPRANLCRHRGSFSLLTCFCGMIGKKCQQDPNEISSFDTCVYSKMAFRASYFSRWLVDVPASSIQWRHFEDPINTPASYRFRAPFGGSQLILRVDSSHQHHQPSKKAIPTVDCWGFRNPKANLLLDGAKTL